jgi:hypothetical protein
MKFLKKITFLLASAIVQIILLPFFIIGGLGGGIIFWLTFKSSDIVNDVLGSKKLKK